MGGSDEQLPSIGGGAGAGGTDLRIEQEPAAPEIALTADPELPPLLEERFITAILENRDDDLKSPKKEIEGFFRENYEQNKRAEYLKSVYPDRFTELMVDGTRIGYKATNDGLLMWEGAYLSRTKESVFSWGIVAELTGNLIDQGTYFFHTKVQTPPSYEDQQISFMDGGYLAPEPEDDQQFTFFSQPELPQQVIDEALCIGYNDRDSRLIICAYFMKDKPLEDNAAFLQKKYGTNGAGLFINDREYAVWYDPEGIRVSSGRSAQKRHATLIPWTQAAKRIRELLDLGRYMPQSELDQVQDFERRQIADSLIYARREFSEAAREAGYAPLTTLAYSVKGGFPESEAQMQKLLEDPATLSQLVDEWTLFAAVHASDRSLLRSRWYDPKVILAYFYVGQYGNFDRLAALAVKQLKKQYPFLYLYLVLPYHPVERSVPIPIGFDGSYYPDGMETVPRRYAIVRANKKMVDSSDWLISYVCHPGSNARNLLEYAQRREEKGLICTINLAGGQYGN